MGISDEDYADALVYEKQKQAQQQQMEKEMAKVSSSTLGIIESGLSNLTLTTANITQPYGQFKVLTEQDLKHDAMKAPLSALVDMWIVRWGSEWANETAFQEDDFWRIALVRLTGANKLEKHNLANQYMSVYRIIE